MDAECKQKYNFLQKYVPFLANLIEVLANDMEKQNKLAQMQLLYDLLNNPDNSVKIETLEKCEEVLCRVFGNNDEKMAEEEWVMPLPRMKLEIPEQENGEEESPENPNGNIDDKSLDESLIIRDKNRKYKEQDLKNNQELQKSNTRTNLSECVQMSITSSERKNILADNDLNYKNDINLGSKFKCTNEDNSIKEEKNVINREQDEAQKINNKDEEKNYNQYTEISTTLGKNDNDIKLHSKELETFEAKDPSNLCADKTVQDDKTESIKVAAQTFEGESLIVIDEKTNSPNKELNRPIPISENVKETKCIEISKCTNPSAKTPDCLNEEKTNKNPADMLGFKIISAKSLASVVSETNIYFFENGVKVTNTEQKKSDINLTAKEISTNSNSINKFNTLCNFTKKSTLEESKTKEENNSASSKNQNNEDYDDDVFLIENRTSPICIDSGPEDEENVVGNCPLPILPRKQLAIKQNSIQNKSKLCKSTSAVVNSIRQIMKKQQNNNPKQKKEQFRKNPKDIRSVAFVKKDPKTLLETIDLLDSDSGDEQIKNQSAKLDDDVIIVGSIQPQRNLLAKKANTTVRLPKQISRLYSKGCNVTPPKCETAQSNFLNAVNLQPIKTSTVNPASFSARLYNKKVIIPNAFYGNPLYNRKSSLSSVPSSSGNNEESSSNDSVLAPPIRAIGVHSGVSIKHVEDKVLKEWLESFITNFADPLQIASHACFVLLQRVLKYRSFQRVKETRILLNQAAKSCSSQRVNVQMLLDLRNVFINNDYITDAGRRFCRFATNDAFGKPTTLTTDSKTGKVTCRTRPISKVDLSINVNKNPVSSVSSPITNPKAVSSNLKLFQTSPSAATKLCSELKLTPKYSTATTSTPFAAYKRKGKFRKLSDGLIVAENDKDDNDYTPEHDEIKPEEEIVTERKRSLRTNRTKRKEAGFTYSEDHDDEEFEALAKKIEEKKKKGIRLAEERELETENEQIEQQRKANKKFVNKTTTSKRVERQIADNTKGPTRKRLRLANTSIVDSEENDLLTATWIEADDADDGEVDSILDFADEPQSPARGTTILLGSENCEESLYQNDEIIDDELEKLADAFDMHTDRSLKNIDRNLHLHNKTHDSCVHCLKKVPRIVHHYVNEHRSSEVFTSRLRNRDIRRLLTTNNVGFVHLYKGNQIQYAANCIFCDKEAKFLLPYWFEHFTMHTGEYSFKCSGCHILKPTRSLLTNHITSNSGCPKKGSAIRLVNFDTKSHQIEAHICSLCNYIQLHRKNLLRHLRTQHGLDTISPNQIIKVILLQISASHDEQRTTKIDESQLSILQHSDDDDDNPNNFSSFDENLMLQNDFTDNDDLSFMICGMLDVQTNISPSG